MLLIPMFFHLKVGNEKYLKQRSLHFIPQTGDLLKIANHSFKVIEVEHDLDAYEGKEYEHGCPCHSIKAIPSEGMYAPDELYSIHEDIKSDGWKKG